MISNSYILKSNASSHKALLFYFGMSILLMYLQPLRLMAIFNTAALIRVILPLVFFYLIINCYNIIRFRLDMISCVLAFYIIQGVVVGLILGNNLYYLCSSVFCVILSLFCYSASLNSNLTMNSMKRLLGFISAAILYSSFLVIVALFFLKYIVGYQIYLSFSTIYLIIPFSYYIIFRNKVKFLLTCMLILVGGKVGVLLSAVFIFLLYYFKISKTLVVALKKNNARLMRLLMIACLLLILVFFVHVLSNYSINTYFPFINKIMTYDPFMIIPHGEHLISYNSFNKLLAHNFGGGRLSEIVSALNKMNTLGTYSYIFGGGFGFTYLQQHFATPTHNIHISLFSLLTTGGFITVFSFYLMMFYYFRKSFSSVRVILMEGGRVYLVMLLISFGYLIYSFTAFSIFVNIEQWFFIGYVVKIRQDIIMKRYKL